VPIVDAADGARLGGDAQRTLFLCDVRSPEEFAQGSLPGAQHTPGGQLIQATDQYVGVRKARLVLFDNDGMRALTVASWLRQLGHDASVLDQGLASGLALPAAAPVALPALARHQRAGAVWRLADGTSRHRPAPQHAIPPEATSPARAGRYGRAWRRRPGRRDRPVVLIADEPAVAACAAVDLQALGLKASLLEGGTGRLARRRPAAAGQ
jgi:rhodanese-related sulfurtransferase